MNKDRRDFLKLGALSLAGSSVLGSSAAFGSPFFTKREEPHFYLSVIFPFGWDNTYLFDARPLEMTTNGKLQNYIGEEPEVWTDSRGVNTYATKLVAPLKEYQNYFSILNGVHMSSSFDGHDQNTNMFFTGSAFGGDGFIPFLSRTQTSVPLEYVQIGRFFSALTNREKSIRFSVESASKLSQNIQLVPEIDNRNRLFRYLRDRAVKGIMGPGLFSEGLRRYIAGIDEASIVSKRLKMMTPPTEEMEDFQKNLQIATEYFRIGMANSAIVASGLFLDTHSANQARDQPKLYTDVASSIRQVIQHLRNTPYDETRSFYDVTTFVVSSEFSRTMRQSGKAIDDTGTDHNPLTNTFLIGGKGIRGNLILGASDYQTSDETLSGAHMEHDKYAKKIMGRPYDFETNLPKAIMPEKYETKDYLSCNSIVNTLYEQFGVNREHYRKYTRDGDEMYPVLSYLLS